MRSLDHYVIVALVNDIKISKNYHIRKNNLYNNLFSYEANKGLRNKTKAAKINLGYHRYCDLDLWQLISMHNLKKINHDNNNDQSIYASSCFVLSYFAGLLRSVIWSGNHSN